MSMRSNTTLRLFIVRPQGPGVWHQWRRSGFRSKQKGHVSTVMEDSTELFPRRVQVPHPRRRACVGEGAGNKQR